MSSVLICVSLVLTLAATIYLYVKNAFSYWKRKGIPFVEPSFPFGNFPATFSKKMSLMEEMEDLYNRTSEPFIGVYSSVQPALLVRDPKIIKDIFIKDFQSFGHRGFEYDVDVDPMAENILLQKGDKWKNVRTQLSPAFSSGKIKAMFDVIVNSGKSMDKFVNDFANTGKKIEIRDVFARYATNVIVSVAFGLDIDCITNRDEEFRKYGPRFFEPTFRNLLRGTLPIMMPKLSKFLRFRFVDKDVGDFMIESVRQNLEYREKNNVSRKDFFQMLMQLRNTGKIQEDDWTIKVNANKKSISLEEMAAHAFLFFVGGFESSSSTMSFLMYELARHQEIQQKAYEEIVEVVEKNNGTLTYDAVADMKYMEQCLNESLRMHPPFGLAGRKCTQNYKIPGTNVVIEEGTLLMFSISGLQYDPKYYDEPKKFNPERHSDTQKAGKGFIEMPNLTFGDGPRNCLGMRLGKLQSKVAIVLLLQKFKFELADEHKNTELKLHPLAAVQTPVNGINLIVTKRSVDLLLNS